MSAPLESPLLPDSRAILDRFPIQARALRGGTVPRPGNSCSSPGRSSFRCRSPSSVVSMRTADMTLLEGFHLAHMGQATKLELGATAFNLCNHPNFGLPNQNLDANHFA